MVNIIFVDENDNVIGEGTKQEAWKKGIAHRIVRIFLFNSKGELLIQNAQNTTSPYRADGINLRQGMLMPEKIT